MSRLHQHLELPDGDAPVSDAETARSGVSDESCTVHDTSYGQTPPVEETTPSPPEESWAREASHTSMSREAGPLLNTALAAFEEDHDYFVR